GPPITVADQNHWPVHGVDGRLRVLLVVGVGGLGGLRHRHLVPILLEDVRDGFPTGAIRECTVHQDHVLDASLRRGTRRGSVQSRAHERTSKCSSGITISHDLSPITFHCVLLFPFVSSHAYSSHNSRSFVRHRACYKGSGCFFGRPRSRS